MQLAFAHTLIEALTTHMARLARLCLPGLPHLLVQRVHDAHLLVRDDADREAFLAALRTALANTRTQLHAYALLDDGFLLLATPSAESGLSELVQAIGRQYVAGYNRRHQRSGGLWAGRFRATVIDPARYLLDAMVFVETHPLRTGLAQRAQDWRWSSCSHHLGNRTDPLVADHALFWQLGNTPFDRQIAYARLLEHALPTARRSEIDAALQRGWALGGADFLARLGEQTDRPLAPRPRGRPRKDAPRL